MIDLHLHTTASDGRLTPVELVDLAAASGLRVMAVTDHDTTGAVADVQACARAKGLEAVAGIEITAVLDGRDVHMLAYFVDIADAAFQRFLVSQRASRVARLEAIGARLAELGVPVRLDASLALARMQSSVSVGRPQAARALVAAGHVKDMHQAFDRWLGNGRPGFVPRVGPPPVDVIPLVHAAGGLISIAHPGRTQIDEHLSGLRDAGLDAIEVYHSDHDEATTARYVALAAELGLLVTGGSDFHDPGSSLRPGSVTLPWPHWDRLVARRAT
ncbi:MAG TPA: PHP domain-containing protein [Vicinamibacterales bacterium]|nr:PHP domain-containing protein [Vicinamibacterales bacterium]